MPQAYARSRLIESFAVTDTRGAGSLRRCEQESLGDGHLLRESDEHCLVIFVHNFDCGWSWADPVS